MGLFTFLSAGKICFQRGSYPVYPVVFASLEHITCLTAKYSGRISGVIRSPEKKRPQSEATSVVLRSQNTAHGHCTHLHLLLSLSPHSHPGPSLLVLPEHSPHGAVRETWPSDSGSYLFPSPSAMVRKQLNTSHLLD